MQKRTTLTSIATLSGVSRQVVSAILEPGAGGTVRYSQETYDKVMHIVAQTGFRPNRTARNLVSNRHGSIGILIREYGLVWGDTLRYILAQANKLGQVVVLDYLPENPQELPAVVREDAVDGIILFEDMEPHILEAIEKAAIPCVRVNTNVRDIAGTITFNEQQAMDLAVQHFVSLGRTSLAIVAGAGNHYSQRLRRKGFLVAARNAGLPPPSVVLLDRIYNTEGLRIHENVLGRLFEKRKSVSGVLLSEDRMAPALYAAAAACGRRIPQDLSVIGVNNSAIASAVSPGLTSLFVRSQEVGTRAVEMLADLIDGKHDGGQPYQCAYQMIPRESA